MEEERVEVSCFLTVLYTEDQSSSQSSSTHVALALHGRSSQPFSQCTLFARIIFFSFKCRRHQHLSQSVLFSGLKFCLTPIWIRLRQIWLYYFCGLFFRFSDQEFGAFSVNFSGGCLIFCVWTWLDSQLRISRPWSNVQSYFNLGTNRFHLTLTYYIFHVKLQCFSKGCCSTSMWVLQNGLGSVHTSRRSCCVQPWLP